MFTILVAIFQHTPIGIRPIEFESGLLLATGLTWKRQRSLMTAPFAAGKIKLVLMFKKMFYCCFFYSLMVAILSHCMECVVDVYLQHLCMNCT